MRIVNSSGRLAVLAGGVVDVAEASGGEFGPDVQAVYDRWPQFRAWASTACLPDGRPLGGRPLGSPAPQPRQVFAIGLNYLDHAEESAMDAPTTSMVVFTKFPASITGPDTAVALPAGSVDFEAELVVVIGRRAYQVDRAGAWDCVAGLTAGQDLSERELQLRPPTPQFSLGESYPGFAPMGPALATVDEFADPDDLEIGCTLNGTQMQKSRTSRIPRRERRSKGDRQMSAKPKFAHVVFQTGQPDAMRDWYCTVLDGHVVYEDEGLAFLTFDDEHHRVALLKAPVPLEPKTPQTAAMHHVAYTFETIDDLLERYVALREAGITPAVCIAHGVTTSMYYRDPDGNMVEMQIDRFAEPDDATAYMNGPEYAADSVGPAFDPEALLEARRAGATTEELSDRTWALQARLPDPMPVLTGAS